jgi:hypothetical protein
MALAISMNERLLIDVVHCKPAVPLTASICHSVAYLNVREGSRPAVRGKRSGYRCFRSIPAVQTLLPGNHRFGVRWTKRGRQGHRPGGRRPAPTFRHSDAAPPARTAVPASPRRVVLDSQRLDKQVDAPQPRRAEQRVPSPALRLEGPRRHHRGRRRVASAASAMWVPMVARRWSATSAKPQAGSAGSKLASRMNP